MTKPHVFIIAALSADGLIARHSEEFADWTSKADKDGFVAATKKARVMILGSRTYKTFGKPLKDRLHIVYSTGTPVEQDPRLTDEERSRVRTTNASPQELIDSLAQEGYTEIAICGGASIYTLFMNSGLVDELRLTYEPVLLGTGISMFNEPIDADLEISLKSQEAVDTVTGKDKKPVRTIFATYSVTRAQRMPRDLAA